MLERDVLTLNSWQFRFGDEPWQPVETPHSWNALDAVHPGEGWYRRGVGCYETKLVTPTGQRTFVRFGAASQKATVCWNDVDIARHDGGYLPFTVELPAGEEGLLHVAVDNEPDPNLIPSDRSDFFLYGGLTRPVTRYTTGPLRIAQVRLDPKLHGDHGVLKLSVRLDGDLHTATTRCRVMVEGADGALLQTHEQAISAAETSIELMPVANPQRWSPDSPTLYRVRVSIWHGDELSDTAVLKFGWRTFDFPPGGPFLLNGERLLLRGTHRHEDWAGCASAVPEAFTNAEMMRIKAAGFNFVRLGHYPQSAQVLDLCDELGLIVWEELPWCRGGVGGERFKMHARTMLTDVIAEHRHHPSIVFWGVGNELDWESDHPDTTDDDVLAFLRELHELSHALDPSRLTALRRYERGANVVDVYSPSIWSGWYRGRYQDYQLALNEAHAKYPRFLHMEWGGDSHIGRHNVGPHLPHELPEESDHSEKDGLAYSDAGFDRASRDGDWSESYMLDLMAWHLRVQQAQPNLAGTAQWAFKDFGTPLRPENPIPYVNQKGLVDRENRPKSIYHLFQAAQTATPVCHIEAPTWPIRAGDTHEPQRVRVITNCAMVELFVDGVAQGTRTEGWLRTWQVTLQPGENRLHTRGQMANGRVIEDTLIQTLVPMAIAPPARWRFHVEPALWRNRPVRRLVAQMVTAAGAPRVDIEQFVTFRLTAGIGKLLVDQGTPDGSLTVQTANGRASILIGDIGAMGAEITLSSELLTAETWRINADEK